MTIPLKTTPSLAVLSISFAGTEASNFFFNSSFIFKDVSF